MWRRRLSLFFNFALALALCWASFNFRLCIYLAGQAKGQLHLIFNTESIPGFKRNNQLSEAQLGNLALIAEIRRYATDSLGFEPSQSYTRIYNQEGKPLLWAVTASDRRAIRPYYWSFPVLGQLSYKGYFDKNKALAERNHLVASGYDVELRPVSAWSTLGWLRDPILSSMLDYSKGNLCNLIFHELFHTTYYAPGSVDDNENLATFIGDKATLQFLAQTDTAALGQYTSGKQDRALFNSYIRESGKRLDTYYRTHPFDNGQKLRLLVQISRGVDSLPLRYPLRFQREKEEILTFKNAYFVGFNQYHRKQDSLEILFSRIHHGNLRLLVEALKQQGK